MEELKKLLNFDFYQAYWKLSKHEINIYSYFQFKLIGVECFAQLFDRSHRVVWKTGLMKYLLRFRLRLKIVVALGSLYLSESNVDEFSYQFIYLFSFDLNSFTVSDRTTMCSRLFKILLGSVFFNSVREYWYQNCCNKSVANWLRWRKIDWSRDKN